MRKTMTTMRIYGGVWLLVLGVTGVTYLTGSINAVTFPVFGFIFSSLAAAGFVAVLPAWLDEHYSPRAYPVAENFNAGSVPLRESNTLPGLARLAVKRTI
jgi:hypothetical protein